MSVSKDELHKIIKEIEELGYTTSIENTNPDYPDRISQLYVYKNGKRIARVSLTLACRLDTMANGVGRNELSLFKILCNLSARI